MAMSTSSSEPVPTGGAATAASATLVDDGGQLVLLLAGDWVIARGPAQLAPVLARLQQATAGTRLTFETSRLGDWDSVLPSFLVGRDFQSGALVPVLEKFLPQDSAVHAVYPHARHLSPKVRAFVDFLAERFGPVPYWDRPEAADRR